MKRKTMGWLIVFLLFIVYMLNYMDRSALSITAPLIEKELGFNAAEMGMIFSAFFIGYALFNFIGGWASDKVGPKTVFLIAALLWSVFCGLTGLVTGLWTMLIVRVLFGMAEGPVSAAGNKIINNWISRKESATAIGIFSAGSPLGGAVSGPIVGLLALSLGWRPAFGIIFLFGLVWVLLWYFIVSDKPTMSKRLAPEERIDFENHEDVILSDDGRATPSLGYYMKQPMVWATTLAFFSYNYILFFFLTWFPSYLNHSLHLDIKEISIATVIPWVIGAIGMVLGGVCSDVIYRITGNALLSRRLILGVCLAGAAVCVAVSGTVSTIGSAITLMSVSLFLLYLTGPIYWAVIQDVVHKDKVGSVGGAMHGLANISGIIGPLVTGFIVQFSGKYDYAFYLAGAIAIVSSLLVFVFVPRIIGHEVTGIVLQEGAGMPDNIKEGDRVIVDPYIYCGHCYPCSVGRTNCCENLNVIGVHVDGAMQEVVTHPAHLIHKIPDNVPSEMAPLAEPLTIALHALHRANVKAGEYVAIIGAGAIGLMAALSARHYKATPILIDIVEERLRYAQKLGVPYVLNAADDQVIDAIKNITHGTMAQVVIEASGANSAIRNTLDLASFAGRISFTGWPKQETSLPTNLITYKELDLRGSRTSAGEFDEALRMLSTLEINPQDVVSKVVNLDEIPDAVKELDRYPERYLKINAVFH
ncbi:MFS transporter [Salmonella enterica subsp. enterica serovar Dublin]|nr:MFS transporter [Salmonella enterica subsp. enterica serovar Dublin]EEF0455999.1 MFS transporter [Salmonella enterica subsp. enterica serovar Dublin]